MEKEKQFLLLCRKLIEQSLNWGDSAAWTNDDFEHLGQKIFDKTKVQLSISTLKRIWGKVRYENFPTTGTLNALAGFLDYESWREFKQKNQVTENQQPEINEPAVVSALPETPEQSELAKPKNGFILLTVGLALIFGAIFFVRQKPKPVDLSKVKFEAKKISDTLPNSVIFNYDASVFQSDSVYIQQSWDPSRRERVDGNGKQHTSVYYEPGYFIAKLVVDNQVKKECLVNIQTKGWKGTIETKTIPIYLSQKEIKNKDFMGITSQLLQQKTGSPVFNKVVVKFANVRDFKNIDPGNFTFETNLRNTSAVEASVCRTINVLILLDGSAIIVPLADKGCISDIDFMAGNNYISGKNHDLSAFGCDFSKFQDLKFTVKNRRIKIYLNNKQIMDTDDKYTGGIAGIRYEFEGAGEVKDVKMFTPGGGDYFESFGH
jgi:hypothetical protein